MRKTVFLLLVLLPVLVGAGRAQSALDAAQLFKSQQANGVAISFLLNRNGQEFSVPSDMVFKTGDRIKINLNTNFDGYVYVFNVNPANEPTLLFPTPEAGSFNLVKSGQKYTIPSADGGWFKFAGEAGEEKLYIIMSAERVPDIEQEFLQSSLAGQKKPASAPASALPAQVQVITPAPTVQTTVEEKSKQVQTAAASQASQPTSAAAATTAAAQTTAAPATAVKTEPATTGQTTATQAATTASTTVNQAAKTVTEPAKTAAQAAKSATAPVQTAEKTVTAAAKTPQKVIQQQTKPLKRVKSGVSTFTDVAGMPPRVVSSVKRLGFRDLVFTNDSMEKTAYVALPNRQDQGPVIFQLSLVHESQ